MDDDESYENNKKVVIWKNVESNCILSILSCIIIGFIVFIVYMCLNTFVYTYSKQECFIESVTGPTKLPSESLKYWNTCRCGAHCVSWVPCVTLTASLDSEKDYKNKTIYDVIEKYGNGNHECTFKNNRKCEKGDQVEIIKNHLVWTNNTIRSYTNSTVSCYWNDDSDIVYLEYNLIVNYIILGITISIFLCVICCLVCVINNRCKCINEI